MDMLYEQSQATAREIWIAMGEKPSYSTVRKILSILEEKGHVRHRSQGATFVYEPVVEAKVTGGAELKRLVHTFFQGSVADVVTRLLGDQEGSLSEDEVQRIEALLAQNRRQKGEKGEQR